MTWLNLLNVRSKIWWQSLFYAGGGGGRLALVLLKVGGGRLALVL